MSFSRLSESTFSGGFAKTPKISSTTSVDKTRETRANRELKAGTKGVANVE
jgi:hypothetical protein